MDKKLLVKGIVLISLIFFIGILAIFFYNFSQQQIASFIENSRFAPLMMILLVVLQVVAAPIPGQFTGLLSGFLFGLWEGTLYSMIGIIISTFIVLFIARKLGRPFIESMVSKKKFRKYDKIVMEKGELALFLIYLLPILPDDILTYIAGLTNIKIHRLVVIAVLGRLPGFIALNYIGSGELFNYGVHIITMISIIVILAVIAFIYKDKIENKIFDVFRAPEN